MFDDIKKVDMDIVHKNNEDDVLIYNIRPMIPAWLDDVTIQEAKNKFSDETFKKFKKFYRLEDDKYVLNSIPSKLSQDANVQVNELFPGINITHDFYEMRNDKLFLSNRWIPEHVEYALSKVSRLNNNLLNIEDRHQLYHLLKQLESSELLGMQYSSLFNNTKNYFFYNKHHEHVPGLMLIEAARQAMYSQFYSYSGYNRNEVSISLHNLSCQFLQYTESCYPVEILVSDSNMNPIKYPKTVDKKAQFFQNHQLVAEVCLQGNVIKMPIFERVRNINISSDRWFAPLKNIKKEVMLMCDDGIQICGKVQFLSISEMQVKIDTTIDYTISDLKSKLSHCVLYVDNIGFVCIPININKCISNNDDTIILNFADLDKKTNLTLKKILKEFCYFVKDKTYYKIMSDQLDTCYTSILNEKY